MGTLDLRLIIINIFLLVQDASSLDICIHYPQITCNNLVPAATQVTQSWKGRRCNASLPLQPD